MGFEEASPIQSETIPVLARGQGCGRPVADRLGQDRGLRHPGHRDAWTPTCARRRCSSSARRANWPCRSRRKSRSSRFFKRGVRELPIYGGAELRPPAPRPARGRADHHRHAGPRDGSPRARHAEARPDRAWSSSTRPTACSTWASATTSRRSSSRRPPSGRRSSSPPRCRRRSSSSIKRYTREPVNIRIEAQAMTVPAIDQVYYEVDRRSKLEVLCRLDRSPGHQIRHHFLRRRR